MEVMSVEEIKNLFSKTTEIRYATNPILAEKQAAKRVDYIVVHYDELMQRRIASNYKLDFFELIYNMNIEFNKKITKEMRTTIFAELNSFFSVYNSGYQMDQLMQNSEYTEKLAYLLKDIKFESYKKMVEIFAYQNHSKVLSRYRNSNTITNKYLKDPNFRFIFLKDYFEQISFWSDMVINVFDKVMFSPNLFLFCVRYDFKTRASKTAFIAD